MVAQLWPAARSAHPAQSKDPPVSKHSGCSPGSLFRCPRSCFQLVVSGGFAAFSKSGQTNLPDARSTSGDANHTEP